MFKRTKLCSGLMLAFGGTLALGASPTFAQQQLERVEITGSSIKRVESEGALPVQIVTREEIARSGVVNTEQLLQSISAISSLGGISLTTGAGSSTYGRATVALRGLEDGRTLILVNGRRVAAFAGGGGAAVNVNAIPLAAIDRVEVLKDGSSAVYGSDAIAGVVNFILSRNFNGIELSGTAGTPSRSGGGQKYQGSIVAGLGDISTDRYNITLSGTLEREKQLFAKDREFAKTGNVYPYIVAGATGLGNIEGGIDPVTGVRAPGFGGSPGRGYGNPLAAADKCESINMFKNPTLTADIKDANGAITRAGKLPYCAFDSAPFVALLPEREAASFTANGALKLTEQVQLFGDALYSKNKVTQRIQASPVRRSFLVTDAEFDKQGVIPALLLRPTNPSYQIAADYLTANGHPELVGQTLAITSRVFDFGPRTAEDTSIQTRFVGGVKGELVGQEYEFAFSRNESKTDGSVIAGYFSQVAYAKIIASPSSDWNPFSLTQSAAFNAQLPAAEYIGPTLSAKSKSDVLDGKLSGDIFALPAGPLQYAAGFQLRKESYVTRPSPALETGDIAGLGGSVPPVDKDRRITAFYGELAVPVLKSLDATVAARSDKYSEASIGSSSTYKASLRWQPTKTVLVRGSIGTGFRAPTLTDMFQPQSLGTSEQFNDPATGQTALQVNNLSGGNPDLKAEKSKQQSVGLVFSPIPALTVGVDLFRINIKDIITTPSAQEVVSRFRAGDPAYASFVTLAPGTNDIDFIKTLITNTGDAKLSGVDIEVGYREKFAAGQLDVNLSGTYMSKFDQTSPGGQVSQKVGTIVDGNGDPVLGASTGGVVLRWKHYLAATWTQGPWNVTFAQNYYRGYEAGFRQIDGERSFIPSQAIYDAQIGFKGIKNLKLSLGVKNLFNKNPPIFVPVSNQFQAGYDVTQYDARARFVYATASYKF